MNLAVSTSTSTRGGVDYDLLCSGDVRGYSFNLIYIDPHKTFQQHIDELIQHINNILLNIEIQSGRQIEEFIIGKTYVRKRKNVDFDSIDYTTFRYAGGINGRWHKTYKNMGYDGLIAIAAITSDQVPYMVKNGPLKNMVTGNSNIQEQYALLLEQALILHFVGTACDQRFSNISFATGNAGNHPFAGVVYVAFKLTPPPPQMVGSVPIG